MLSKIFERDMAPGYRGILEPHPHGTLVSWRPKVLDLAIIPGIAFDLRGRTTWVWCRVL